MVTTIAGDLTDVPGLLVGHAQDEQAQTGCTVVLCPRGATVGADVRGAAPGTRETDLCRPGNLVTAAHGVLLSGGSAFGLAAADGVMGWLEEQGVGLPTGAANVPIVPAAVLYDLAVGDARVRPHAAMGRQACENARGGPVARGRVGAGTGATVGKLLGPAFAQPGGIGTASWRFADGTVVAALIAVNAVGDIWGPAGIVAGAKNEQGFLDSCACLMGGMAPGALLGGSGPVPGTNTTIGVVATNAKLTKEQVNRLAAVGHNGLARCIRPVHTQFDGDTLFGLATGETEGDLTALLTAVPWVVEAAVLRAFV